jgi:hypothetical protein
MSTPDFPANSQSKRPAPAPDEEPKKIERITQSEARQRKKSPGRRAKEFFFGGDARSAGSHIWTDLLVPAVKDMLVHSGQEYIEMMIWGGDRSRVRGRGPVSRAGVRLVHTAYDQASRGAMRPDPRVALSRQQRANFDFDDIIIPSRVEAEAVIDGLWKLIDQYQVASVKDLYDAIGIEPAYTDHNFGWVDLTYAKARRVKDGYLLDLPRPEPLV